MSQNKNAITFSANEILHLTNSPHLLQTSFIFNSFTAFDALCSTLSRGKDFASPSKKRSKEALINFYTSLLTTSKRNGTEKKKYDPEKSKMSYLELAFGLRGLGRRWLEYSFDELVTLGVLLDGNRDNFVCLKDFRQLIQYIQIYTQNDPPNLRICYKTLHSDLLESMHELVKTEDNDFSSTHLQILEKLVTVANIARSKGLCPLAQLVDAKKGSQAAIAGKVFEVGDNGTLAWGSQIEQGLSAGVVSQLLDGLGAVIEGQEVLAQLTTDRSGEFVPSSLHATLGPRTLHSDTSDNHNAGTSNRRNRFSSRLVEMSKEYARFQKNPNAVFYTPATRLFSPKGSKNKTSNLKINKPVTPTPSSNVRNKSQDEALLGPANNLDEDELSYKMELFKEQSAMISEKLGQQGKHYDVSQQAWGALQSMVELRVYEPFPVDQLNISSSQFDDNTEKLFRMMDANGDGVISKVELIKFSRTNVNKDFQDLLYNVLKIPPSIRQEDGTKDIFMEIFHDIDTDSSGNISLSELECYLRKRQRSIPKTLNKVNSIENIQLFRSKVTDSNGSLKNDITNNINSNTLSDSRGIGYEEDPYGMLYGERSSCAPSDSNHESTNIPDNGYNINNNRKNRLDSIACTNPGSDIDDDNCSDSNHITSHATNSIPTISTDKCPFWGYEDRADRLAQFMTSTIGLLETGWSVNRQSVDQQINEDLKSEINQVLGNILKAQAFAASASALTVASKEDSSNVPRTRDEIDGSVVPALTDIASIDIKHIFSNGSVQQNVVKLLRNNAEYILLNLRDAQYTSFVSLAELKNSFTDKKVSSNSDDGDGSCHGDDNSNGDDKNSGDDKNVENNLSTVKNNTFNVRLLEDADDGDDDDDDDDNDDEDDEEDVMVHSPCECMLQLWVQLRKVAWRLALVECAATTPMGSERVSEMMNGSTDVLNVVQVVTEMFNTVDIDSSGVITKTKLIESLQSAAADSIYITSLVKLLHLPTTFSTDGGHKETVITIFHAIEPGDILLTELISFVRGIIATNKVLSNALSAKKEQRQHSKTKVSGLDVQSLDSDSTEVSSVIAPSSVSEDFLWGGDGGIYENYSISDPGRNDYTKNSKNGSNYIIQSFHTASTAGFSAEALAALTSARRNRRAFSSKDSRQVSGQENVPHQHNHSYVQNNISAVCMNTSINSSLSLENKVNAMHFSTPSFFRVASDNDNFDRYDNNQDNIEYEEVDTELETSSNLSGYSTKSGFSALTSGYYSGGFNPSRNRPTMYSSSYIGYGKYAGGVDTCHYNDDIGNNGGFKGKDLPVKTLHKYDHSHRNRLGYVRAVIATTPPSVLVAAKQKRKQQSQQQQRQEHRGSDMASVASALTKSSFNSTLRLSASAHPNVAFNTTFNSNSPKNGIRSTVSPKRSSSVPPQTYDVVQPKRSGSVPTRMTGGARTVIAVSTTTTSMGMKAGAGSEVGITTSTPVNRSVSPLTNVRSVSRRNVTRDLNTTSDATGGQENSFDKPKLKSSIHTTYSPPDELHKAVEQAEKQYQDKLILLGPELEQLSEHIVTLKGKLRASKTGSSPLKSSDQELQPRIVEVNSAESSAAPTLGTEGTGLRNNERQTPVARRAQSPSLTKQRLVKVNMNIFKTPIARQRQDNFNVFKPEGAGGTWKRAGDAKKTSDRFQSSLDPRRVEKEIAAFEI